MKCLYCGSEAPAREHFGGKPKQFCSNTCRVAYSRKRENYDANSIRILGDQEVKERYQWADAGAIAEHYMKPLEHVQRALEACMRAGVSSEYYVRRYCERDGTPLDPLVDEAMRQHVLEVRP